MIKTSAANSTMMISFFISHPPHTTPVALMRISGFEIYFSILGTSTRIGLNGFITFFEHYRVKGLIFDLFCNTMKMLFFTFGQSQSPIPPSEIRISRRDGTKNYSGMVHLVQSLVQQK
jgi:hypothetical protein